MKILEMILPRLETMAQLASDRSVVRDAFKMAELREDYRYMANVSMSLMPELEPQLADLPDPVGFDAPIEDKVAYQMSLIRQTNRLFRAVQANLIASRVIREERRRQAGSAE
ncbi:MAG TPA: hypothetical protein VN863_02830 [Candidatus Dormibacteraeota bacterium]|nr:hypothetical protein [Candidatus Dormibacteraeota bacterium]